MDGVRQKVGFVSGRDIPNLVLKEKKFNRLLAQINSNMNATEAKRKLCELRSSLRDKEADKAIWIAIRAIDTCTENGFIVED